MATNPPKAGKGTLARDSKGVPVHHVSISLSLYAQHALAVVRKADPRGDGRPPRTLASVRVDVGFLALVGLPSVDAALMIVRAVELALARGPDNGQAQPPAPPEGVTGAAVDPLRTDKLPGL